MAHWNRKPAALLLVTLATLAWLPACGGGSSPPAALPAPSVTSVTPPAGPVAGGLTVTIAGANFVQGASVRFGAASASVTGVLPGAITAVTPAHAAGAVDVVVTNPDLQAATLAGGFTYEAAPPPPPTLLGISPQVGPTAGGISVTLTGTGFVAGATVSFGGAAGAVTTLSPTSITVTTPARAAGAVAVTVVNPDGGSATLPGAFTFEPPATGTPPVITSLAPSSGPPAGGAVCVISGSGFLTGAVVVFGGTLATLAPGTAVTDGSISVTVPAHAVGVVDVTVSNPGGLSATRVGGYTYLGAPPVLQSINVRGGPTAGGTQVLGVGTGFVAGITVTVGGTPATNVTLLNVNPSRVDVRFFTPPMPEGRYDVVVTNPDLQSSTLPTAFHYGPPPVITELLCSNGCATVRPGDTLTFNGANFATAPGEGFSVQFTSTDTGQSASAPAQSAIPTQIVVLAPTLDGGGRQYRISISNFDGQTAVVGSPVIYQ